MARSSLVCSIWQRYDFIPNIRCYQPEKSADPIIHDRLQPLGLSRSETIVSFNAVIDRQLPVPEDIIEDDEDDADFDDVDVADTTD